MSQISRDILSDITVHMKYAKYIPELNRRETWGELVTRNKAMHIKKYPNLKEEIQNAYQYVYDKKVLPSMRSPVNPLKYLRTGCIIVVTYLLTTLIALARLCSYFFQAVGWVIRCSSITLEDYHTSLDRLKSDTGVS